ncbi:MAG TPA: LegC family aminotransferase [Vicinamibacterales bacterium]|jgi:perosamine synthetase|nr:LegC family aminotransferase [Vicinamibacterales bacterium]
MPLVRDGFPAALHEPLLDDLDQEAVRACVESGWVSTAGPAVERFEQMLREYTKASHVVCVNTGTAALQVALLGSGVRADDEVLVPAISFVATANAVSYCHAVPHFVDVDEHTCGMDATRLYGYLQTIARASADGIVNRHTGRRISALVPVHAFGHISQMPAVEMIAQEFHLIVVEDAAQAVGSWRDNLHAGRWGRTAALSFNGNKIITTGGGGAIMTEDAEVAGRVRHLVSTARRQHRWEIAHDAVGFNYRMPSLNAALGVSQLAKIEALVTRKRELAAWYMDCLGGVSGLCVLKEPPASRSNYWLNVVVMHCEDADLRDQLIAATHDVGIMTRPLWEPLHRLPMYTDCPRMKVSVAERLADRVICLPSGPTLQSRIGFAPYH